jgi:photosystem II stability/assembly factor-like uncharacterized protein
MIKLSLVSAATLIMCLTACHSRKKPNTDIRKMAPYDFFEMTRNYPDFKTDLAGFRQVLEQSRMFNAKRSGKFNKNWTLEGPGNIGGRFNCLEFDPKNHQVMYAGSACGGIFKTSDGGNNWVPLFDSNAYLSIGCIAIDPNNSNIVYAGTGDPVLSGSSFTGNGVYKSLNGGKTWNNIGLTETGIVSQIVIHPSNPQILYAATMGFVMRKDSSRGLYKSTNGGNTWNRVFSLGDEMGVIDLVLDKNNPQTLYAAGMLRVRTNQVSKFNSDRTRIYKSTDGGSSWQVSSNGLPTGKICRINLDIFYKGSSSYVYASVVDTSYNFGGIFKTTDNGSSWTKLGTSGIPASVYNDFGWYFGHIKANPFVENELYLLGVDLYKTTNDGASWQMACPEWWKDEVHADKHELRFLNADTLILATDGGIYRSANRSVLWEDLENIPATQFYRVAYNPWEPELYYGGAQDNGTSAGNSEDINNWSKKWGGDGFMPAFNPDFPELRYYSTQNGRIYQLNADLGSWKVITSSFGNEDDSNDRYNWDTPYKISLFNSSDVYFGSHKMYKYDDVNSVSTLISDDLTDGNIFGARFHTISCIAESFFNQGELFIGTSDGNVKRTLNDGGSWTSITQGLPKRYVSSVKTSPNNDSTIYVTFTGYKYNEMLPHVFKSTDKGNTWKNISGNLPNWPVNDILPMEGNDSIIFVATDGGVYGTLDNGLTWERVGKGMPICPVYSLVVNPFKKTLAAGTHARSLMSYPIDDLFDKPVGITAINPLAAIDIYPNPSGPTLELKNIPEGTNLTYRIYDLSGKVHITGKTESGQKIDIHKLKDGQYIVELKSGAARITKKIVKNN